MEAKEKALELVNKFKPYCGGSTVDHGRGQRESAKKCALLYVDGILELLLTLHKPEYTAFLAKEIYTIDDTTEYEDYYHGYDISEYFEQVKEEINKL